MAAALPGWQQTPAAKPLLRSPVAGARAILPWPNLGVLAAPCTMPGTGNVGMSITRHSQVVFSLTYLCILAGDRQRLDLQ